MTEEMKTIGTETVQTPAELSFEKAMLRLEALVAKLEKGNLSLEQSMKLYQQGIQLADICGKTLAKAQLRLSEMESDNPEEKEDGE